MRLGELERAVLNVLWQRPGGVFAREVAEALPSRPATTTVLTVLDRLARKDLVTRTKQGRAYRYSPVASKEAYLAAAMRAAMDESDDRNAVLSHFLGSVSEAEIRAVRAALEELDNDAGEDPAGGQR